MFAEAVFVEAVFVEAVMSAEAVMFAAASGMTSGTVAAGLFPAAR